jgi:hypothetical protein
MAIPLVNGYRLVSNSEIQTYKSCKRKWWLAYFRGLTSRTVEVQGVRSTGTRLHIGWQAFYQPGVQSAQAAIDALREAQAEDLAKLQPDQFGFLNDDLRKKLISDFDLERIMLEGYFEWLAETGADADLEVVSSETYLEGSFPVTLADGSPPVKVIGKVDTRVVDRRTGRRRFMDHKSVTVFEDPQLLRLNEQTLHYLLLEWLNTGEGEARCDAAYYNMARRVKRTAKAVPPFYQRITIERNQHELESYIRRLTGVIGDIQRTEQTLDARPEMAAYVAYPTPSRDCTWKCPFFKVCPLFDDGSRVEAAVEAQYVQHNPLDYYQGREEVEE